MSKSSQIQTRLRKIIRQLSGKAELEGDEEMIPEVAIGGKGILFCFLPDNRTMVRIHRGIKAYIVDDVDPETGRVLIYTWCGQLVEIDPDELIHTGFD